MHVVVVVVVTAIGDDDDDDELLRAGSSDDIRLRGLFRHLHHGAGRLTGRSGHRKTQSSGKVRG